MRTKLPHVPGGVELSAALCIPFLAAHGVTGRWKEGKDLSSASFPAGKARGFGFAGFMCRAHAEKAIALANGKVGKPIFCCLGLHHLVVLDGLVTRCFCSPALHVCNRSLEGAPWLWTGPCQSRSLRPAQLMAPVRNIPGT